MKLYRFTGVTLYVAGATHEEIFYTLMKVADAAGVNLEIDTYHEVDQETDIGAEGIRELTLKDFIRPAKR